MVAAAAIWTVNIPSFMGAGPGAPGYEGVTAMSMFVTSGFGTLTICLYAITFFPPTWYRVRLPSPGVWLDGQLASIVLYSPTNHVTRRV